MKAPLFDDYCSGTVKGIAIYTYDIYVYLKDLLSTMPKDDHDYNHTCGRIHQCASILMFITGFDLINHPEDLLKVAKEIIDGIK